jgi:hypothetical protein
MPDDFQPLDGADQIATALGWICGEDTKRAGKPDRDRVYREYKAGRLDVDRLPNSRQLTSSLARLRRRYEPVTTKENT